MALGVIDRPVTAEALAAAMIGDSICLAERKRNGRRHVRLYRDKAGVAYIRDRYGRRRDIVAIRFLTIDGRPLETGSAVLAKESR